MKRLAFLAVVACLCGCALAGTGRADDIVISDLANPSGGFGQADEFGQAFINGTVAEAITSVQIFSTFGTVPENPSR
jgi:hypothetical protein